MRRHLSTVRVGTSRLTLRVAYKDARTRTGRDDFGPQQARLTRSHRWEIRPRRTDLSVIPRPTARRYEHFVVDELVKRFVRSSVDRDGVGMVIVAVRGGRTRGTRQDSRPGQYGGHVASERLAGQHPSQRRDLLAGRASPPGTRGAVCDGTPQRAGRPRDACQPYGSLRRGARSSKSSSLRATRRLRRPCAWTRGSATASEPGCGLAISKRGAWASRADT